MVELITLFENPEECIISVIFLFEFLMSSILLEMSEYLASVSISSNSGRLSDNFLTFSFIVSLYELISILTISSYIFLILSL